jgi:hypothetical protein
LGEITEGDVDNCRGTESKRLSRGLKAIKQRYREYRHQPRKEQHKGLSLKLKGHYAYYGISLNYEGIGEFLWGSPQDMVQMAKSVFIKKVKE